MKKWKVSLPMSNRFPMAETEEAAVQEAVKRNYGRLCYFEQDPMRPPKEKKFGGVNYFGKVMEKNRLGDCSVTKRVVLTVKPWTAKN